MVGTEKSLRKTPRRFGRDVTDKGNGSYRKEDYRHPEQGSGGISQTSESV